MSDEMKVGGVYDEQVPDKWFGIVERRDNGTWEVNGVAVRCSAKCGHNTCQWRATEYVRGRFLCSHHATVAWANYIVRAAEKLCKQDVSSK